MAEEVELSVGLLPGNKNIYIVSSGGKEFIINSGVTLMAIDGNGERHNLGCTLSADYFFKLVTKGVDEEHERSIVKDFLPKAWGVGSEFSCEEMKKKDEKIWKDFIEKYK